MSTHNTSNAYGAVHTLEDRPREIIEVQDIKALNALIVEKQRELRDLSTYDEAAKLVGYDLQLSHNEILRIAGSRKAVQVISGTLSKVREACIAAGLQDTLTETAHA